MARSSRCLVVLAVLAVVWCGGCIKVGVDVAVAPDLSSSARLVAGHDTSLADPEATPKGPFAELIEAAPERWKTRSYTEGNWQMEEAVGHAGPGEALFPPEEGGPQLQVQTSARRLSTRYSLGLITPPMPTDLGARGGGAGGDEEMGAEFAKMAGALMAQMEIRFSLRGPGRVVATTGKVVGPGKAEWKLDFAALDKAKQLPDFRVTTELPNWENIGRLAAQIVQQGGAADAGCKLAAALERDLLPNPPVNVAAGEKLGVVDYLRLLEVIDRLDLAGSPAATDDGIKHAKLNDQDVTSWKIAAIHRRVMQLDVEQVAAKATLEALTGALSGR